MPEPSCSSFKGFLQAPQQMQKLPSVLESLLASVNNQCDIASISCRQAKDENDPSLLPSNKPATSSSQSLSQPSAGLVPQIGSTDSCLENVPQQSEGLPSEDAKHGRAEASEQSKKLTTRDAEHGEAETFELCKPEQHHSPSLQWLWRHAACTTATSEVSAAGAPASGSMPLQSLTAVDGAAQQSPASVSDTSPKQCKKKVNINTSSCGRPDAQLHQAVMYHMHHIPVGFLGLKCFCQS